MNCIWNFYHFQSCSLKYQTTCKWFFFLVVASLLWFLLGLLHCRCLYFITKCKKFFNFVMHVRSKIWLIFIDTSREMLQIWLRGVFLWSFIPFDTRLAKCILQLVEAKNVFIPRRMTFWTIISTFCACLSDSMVLLQHQPCWSVLN